MIKRRLSVIVLVLFFITLLIPPIRATATEIINTQAETTTRQAQDILNEIATIRTVNAVDNQSEDLDPHLSESEQERIAQLEDELELLDVTKTSVSELNTKFPEASVRTPIIPANTPWVDWYLQGTDYVFEGTIYKVYFLYAQGNSSNSMLWGGANSAHVHTTDSVVLTTINEIASVYIGRLVGDIVNQSKLLKYLPYEIFLPEYERIADLEHNVTYRYTVTSCISYVRPYYDTDGTEEWAYASTSATITHYHEFAGFEDNVPIAESSESFTNTFVGNGYASAEAACKSYKYETAVSTGFAYQYIIADHTCTYRKTVKFPTPSSRTHIY